MNISALTLFATINLFGFGGPLTWPEIDTMINDKFPGVNHMEIDELLQRQKELGDIVLLDVREEEEYAISHLPGAIHTLSPHTLPLAQDRFIVVYCSVGYRSARAVQEFQARGYPNVYNLRGSIFAWANRGLPLEANGTTTHLVHPYNKKWGVLLKEELHKYPTTSH